MHLLFKGIPFSGTKIHQNNKLVGLFLFNSALVLILHNTQSKNLCAILIDKRRLEGTALNAPGHGPFRLTLPALAPPNSLYRDSFLIPPLVLKINASMTEVNQ